MVFPFNKGGPGCSSMDGMYLEVGPYQINLDLSISLNNYSWHKASDIVFLDQPFETGYSYGPVPNNMKNVAGDMVDFFALFFAEYPDLKDRHIILAGIFY